MAVPFRSLAERHPVNYLAALFASALITGCAIIEPSATARFSAKPGTSAGVVYTCAASTIRSLKAQRGTWSDVVTTRDLAGGVFETGHFKKTNIQGIRVQIRYRSATGDGDIKVKASGPYFADLGADQAAVQLANGIAQCL